MKFLSIIWLIFIPLLTSILLMSPLFPNHEVKIRRFSKGVGIFNFIYSLMFLLFYDINSYSMAFENELKIFGKSWLDTLGIKLNFAVDGFSLLLVILTTFITLLAIIMSKNTITRKHKLYYSMIFLLQTAVLGVFCAKDMFVFFLFWELELIPMYFLISQWGSGDAKKSAMKFILYTFTGSIFMLLSILCIYFYNFAISNVLTAEIEVLNVNETIFPMWFQILMFTGLFIGFAVKLPIVPLHSWLPDAHSDAPTPVSMLLAGVLLKMGAYGLIRFNMQIFPEIFKLLSPVILFLGVINIIYAGLIAYFQKDIKRVIAYSSISHMGVVLVGLGALNYVGLTGAIFQMLAHGIIVAGLFMIVGSIYVRTKNRNIIALGGLGSSMPKLMYLSLVIVFGSVGVPLLMGFPGEIMSLIGVFTTYSESDIFIFLIGILAILGLILSLCYMLRLLHKIFFSEPMEQWKNIKDLVPHEIYILFSLCLVIIAFGLCPSLLIDIYNSTTNIIMDLLQI